MVRARRRSRNAICNFCDTDFIGTDGPGGGKFRNATELTKKIVSSHWPSNSNINKFVVFTGGEPLLQLNESLIEALHLSASKLLLKRMEPSKHQKILIGFV